MRWFWQKELEIGQIWTMKESDPFRQCEFEAKIIDIQKGYILCDEGIARWFKEKYPDSGFSKISSSKRSYKESDFRFHFSVLAE